MTALFALATSFLWGLADFGGGLLSRRTPALTVVVVSQCVAVAAVPASLYPVVTALAARGLLSERLRAVQTAGAGPALAGTVLLAAG
jgi:drug/metabolite transporter (DMT)-like permease